MTRVDRLLWTALSLAGIVAAARGLAAQPVRPAGGPTRLTIAAGTVTDVQSRAGLLGVWEPDADLGAAPGANQLTYFADGVYLTPLGNITLVGLWDATARSLTLTPLEVRDLSSGALVPEMKTALAQIAWGATASSTLTWLDPDRYRESGSEFGRRRASPARDLDVVHLSALEALVAGAWVDERGVVTQFLPGGLFREYHPAGGARFAVARGYRRFDAATGQLHVTIERVEAAAGPGPSPVVATGARAPVPVRVRPGDVFEIAGTRWHREKPYVRGGAAMR